jgi:glycerol-3-phosphate dehydrogenase
VAEKTVDAVFRKLGSKPARSQTAFTPLYGGQMGTFEKYLTEETRRGSGELSEKAARFLMGQYGSAYSNVLRYAKNTREGGPATLDLCSMINAEVLHGIREEMAQKLADIVFRRTTLGLPGHLTETSLKTAAATMAKELGWNEERVRREIAEVRAISSRATLATEEAA